MQYVNAGDSLAEGDVIHELDVERWAFWSPESPHPAIWRTHWTGPDARAVRERKSPTKRYRQPTGAA